MKKILSFLLVAIALSFSSTLFSGCGKAKGGGPAVASENEPDVTFKDLQGNNVTLGSYKGKVVLLNFWATWCEPCRTEIPWMIEFQQKYSTKGFTMLGVAMDDEGKSVVDPFIHKTQFSVNGQQATMDYPIVLGTDDIASKLGGLIGLPTSVIISKDGKIVKRYIGLVDHNTIDKEIQSLL
jgi:thiol-disulfide isomerase/thioredoxin